MNHTCPPWIPPESYAKCMYRRVEIERQLSAMGADHAYCMNYFQSGGGVCERTVGRKCKKHRACATPLPPGKVCALEYGTSVSDLRRKIAKVEQKRQRLRKEWEHLRTLQKAEGFMVENAERQEELELRKAVIRNELSHKFKELRDLMGERLGLLHCDPIDANHFHETVSGLLVEKIALMEWTNLGIAPPSGQEIWGWVDG